MIEDPSTAGSSLSEGQRVQLRKALRDTHFQMWNESYFETEAYQRDLRDHVDGRYDLCRRIFVPWLQRAIDLTGKHMVEIGCGTGSSTAAIAPHLSSLHAYDILERSIDAARLRFDIMGLGSKATWRVIQPHTLLQQMRADVTGEGGPGSTDIVLLYAVLEHQPVEERIETLRTSWELLRPGGVLVVTDTPNRLCYYDWHTADLPFFHMLPDRLAIPYTQKSPRAEIWPWLSERIQNGGWSSAIDALNRPWGRGASYHEFELALGDLTNLVVVDGWATEMADHLGMTLEEELLVRYWKEKPVNVPIGFARRSLDIILKKPAAAE
jgi:2-polyprenyl-3-methyl-5-hydroxy-6-metoxy-1,4-benzoquinol methylase